MQILKICIVEFYWRKTDHTVVMKPAGCAGWLKKKSPKRHLSDSHSTPDVHQSGLLQPHEVSPEKASVCLLLAAWSSLQSVKTKEAPP